MKVIKTAQMGMANVRLLEFADDARPTFRDIAMQSGIELSRAAFFGVHFDEKYYRALDLILDQVPNFVDGQLILFAPIVVGPTCVGETRDRTQRAFPFSVRVVLQTPTTGRCDQITIERIEDVSVAACLTRAGYDPATHAVFEEGGKRPMESDYVLPNDVLIVVPLPFPVTVFVGGMRRDLGVSDVTMRVSDLLKRCEDDLPDRHAAIDLDDGRILNPRHCSVYPGQRVCVLDVIEVLERCFGAE